MTLTEAEEILATAQTVLLVDWPSREVPESLARAGFDVIVKGGPGPGSYRAHRVRDGEVVSRPVDPPAHADIVYTHRPLAELAGLTAMARDLGATAVWSQSGRAATGADDPQGCWVPAEASQEARSVVEAAGLSFVDDTYIVAAIAPGRRGALGDGNEVTAT